MKFTWLEGKINANICRCWQIFVGAGIFFCGGGEFSPYEACLKHWFEPYMELLLLSSLSEEEAARKDPRYTLNAVNSAAKAILDELDSTYVPAVGAFI